MKKSENEIELYNEIAQFYDSRPIGIQGLWQLHFFMRGWLNKHHDLCKQGDCTDSSFHLNTNIDELELSAKKETEKILNGRFE